MSRFHVPTLAAAALFAASANAQVVPGPVTVAAPGSSALPGSAPPGIFFNGGIPAYGYNMNAGFARGNTIEFVGPRGTAVPFFSGGIGGYYPSYGLAAGFAYGYPYGIGYSPYLSPFTPPSDGSANVAPPPLLPTGSGPVTNIRLSGLPTTLTLEFPAAADVWLNGTRVDGSAAATRELTSPTVEPGTPYVFDVRAEWTADGKTYGYDRKVTVAGGERAKVTVLAGTPLK